MLKLYKQLKAQTYLDISNIMVGNTILLNYGAKNGIYTVKSAEIVEREAPVRFGGYYFGGKSWNKSNKNPPKVTELKILTENYEIFINPGTQVPVKDGKWILRYIPISGQYWLMKGRKLDCISKSRRPIEIIRTKNKLVKVEHFDDPIKFYSDSKTKEILTQKNTSKYSKVHKVIVRSHGYGKNTGPEFKEKLIEFGYNKNNFLIPFNIGYSIYDNTFEVPNDVVKIGKRCFSGLRFKVIELPNHKIIFKPGALLGCNLFPTNIINSSATLSLKDELLVKGGTMNNVMYMSNYHEIMLDGSSSKSDARHTDFYIDTSKLKVGDVIKFPTNRSKTFKYGYSTDFTEYIKSTVIDVRSDKIILDIGTFSLIDGKFCQVE